MGDAERRHLIADVNRLRTELATLSEPISREKIEEVIRFLDSMLAKLAAADAMRRD